MRNLCYKLDQLLYDWMQLQNLEGDLHLKCPNFKTTFLSLTLSTSFRETQFDLGVIPQMCLKSPCVTMPAS